jgi:hypothetical protein
LPCRAILEPDEHLTLVRHLTQFLRECLIDPALACVRIDCRPNCFAGLGELREACPVCCWALDQCLERDSEGDFILSPATVRDGYGSFIFHPAVDHVFMQWSLVVPDAALNYHFS